MTTRAGFRGYPPAAYVGPSPRRQALAELELCDWWRQAVAEANGNTTNAIINVLRERTDDPLLALVVDDLVRFRKALL